jgi:small neutral amino acid transporter SnatA (MarC family)
MTEEEKTAYLRKKIARKERRKLATRNALAVLGMLGGVATIAAGAATLQIPVVAAGIALFGTAGMKLDFSRKKKKRPEDEKAWEVSEHD